MLGFGITAGVMGGRFHLAFVEWNCSVYGKSKKTIKRGMSNEA